MKQFIENHQQDIVHVLSGLDRLVITGYLRILCSVPGVMDLLSRSGVLFKDFGSFVEEKTRQLKEASLAEAKRLQRPIEYLASPQISKEERAREIAQRDGIEEGLICVLTAVEPCMSFEVQRNRQLKQSPIVRAVRKCLFLYHYWIDRVFGFMHARIQTWMPFTIRICLNGREWLARQLNGEGLSYRTEGNCFVWLQDPQRAQHLMNQQLATDWPHQCERLARLLNPAGPSFLEPYHVPYYWSVHQSEWATDLLFRSRQRLERLYPALVRQTMIRFDSRDVLRFLGKELHYLRGGAVQSSYLRRPEGVRVKHRLNTNSIKMYDKAGQILRVETTIDRCRDFRVYRRAEGKPDSELRWRCMRKGVADLHARCRFSQSCNERYLTALADFQVSLPIKELLDQLSRPIRWKKARFRGLRAWCAADQALLQAISRPELQLRGFRNRDLLEQLYGSHLTKAQRASLAPRVTYRLRLLRAHGLIKKIPRTHAYRLTQKGRQKIPPLLDVYQLDIQHLTELAA